MNANEGLVICAVVMPSVYPSLATGIFRTAKEPYRYFCEYDEPQEDGSLRLTEISDRERSEAKALRDPIPVQPGHVLVLLEGGIEYIPREQLRGRCERIFEQSLQEAEELFKGTHKPWNGLETLMLRAGQARFTDAIPDAILLFVAHHIAPDAIESCEDQVRERLPNANWNEAARRAPTLWAAVRAHPGISKILG